MNPSAGRYCAQAGMYSALCRLLLAAGIAVVVWLPLPREAANIPGRLWASAVLGVMLVAVLVVFPLPGETLLVRVRLPAHGAMALALTVGSGAVIALTGGWQSPLEFLYVLPALCLDPVGGGATALVASALVLITYMTAGSFGGHGTPGPMLASMLMGRAGVWAALAGAILLLRRQEARRQGVYTHVRQLVRHAESHVLALERARGELLAHVSHELLTPLSAIRAGASMLAEPSVDVDAGGAQAANTATYRRVAVNVHRNATRLTLLVDDLLELARLEEGKSTLRLGWHHCSGVLERATESVAVLAEGRQQDIAWSVASEGLLVWGDAQRIDQVLVNLLANAHKYAGEGARIVLTARAAHQGVTFEVCDNGPGVGLEAVAHLFDRYYRGPGSPGQGSGLGLAIASALADLHCGRIWVENNSGAGCRFIFWLPNPAAAPGSGVDGSEEDEG